MDYVILLLILVAIIAIVVATEKRKPPSLSSSSLPQHRLTMLQQKRMASEIALIKAEEDGDPTRIAIERSILEQCRDIALPEEYIQMLNGMRKNPLILPIHHSIASAMNSDINNLSLPEKLVISTIAYVEKQRINPEYKILFSSELTTSDVAIFATFITRILFLLDCKDRHRYVPVDNQFVVKAKKVISAFYNTSESDEMYANRALFYFRVFQAAEKQSPFQHVFEEFKNILLVDLETNEYQPYDEKSSLMISDIFASTQIQAEILNFVENLPSAVEPYLNQLRRVLNQ